MNPTDGNDPTIKKRYANHHRPNKNTRQSTSSLTRETGDLFFPSNHKVVDDGEAVVPGTDSVFLVSDSSDEDFETREARLEQQEETDDESESPEVQVG